MNDPSKTTGTHTVFNQPPPLDPYNLFSTDTPLKEALKSLVWAEPILNDYGYLTGHELFPAGFFANQNLPQLRTHDRFGHRIDQVDFHPAYHQLMKAAIAIITLAELPNGSSYGSSSHDVSAQPG